MPPGLGFLFSIIVALASGGCAYQFGYAQRTLPGGFKQVAVPVFQNITKEVGIERYFTDALVREFDRSRVAQVVDRGVAPVVIEGTIKSIDYKPSSLISANSDTNTIGLPANTVLATEYQVLITANVVLRRISDQKILWQGVFNSEQVYQAPQVGMGTLNTVNPLYNHSAHKTVVEQLAKDMMNDAHDRMTENF
jgi:hypothetical protein